MLHNSPLDITACIDVTSVARLSSYCDFFGVGNAEAYSIYKWNNELSSRLMHQIGIVEVVLRNRIHEALISELNSALPQGTMYQDRWYNFINKEGDTQRKLDSELLYKKTKTPRKPIPSANQIISKMSFGFWPNILKNSTYLNINNQKKSIDWDNAFKNIFPGLNKETLGYWNSFVHRDPIIARCFSVNDLRNRVAHFEPVWKFGKDPSETVPRQGGVTKTYSQKPKNVGEMLIRLSRDFNRVNELLNWLSPETYRDYQHSENHREISWLISEGAINAFVNHAKAKKIPVNALTKPRQLKKISKVDAGCSILTMNKVKVGLIFIYP